MSSARRLLPCCSLSLVTVFSLACGTRSELGGPFELLGAGGAGQGGASQSSSSQIGVTNVTATTDVSTSTGVGETVGAGGSFEVTVTATTGQGGAEVATSTGAGGDPSTTATTGPGPTTTTATVGTAAVASSSSTGGGPVEVNCVTDTCTSGEVCCFDDDNAMNNFCAMPGGCGFGTIPIACTGANDCAQGEVCCAIYQEFGPGPDGYKGVKCTTSCQTQQVGQMALVMCADDPSVCTNGMTCKDSKILPDGFLYCGF